MDDPSESPSGTLLRTYQDPPIIDRAGVVWRISPSFQVDVDGNIDRTTHDVVEIGYFNRQVWYYSRGGLWWFKSNPNDRWQPDGGMTQAPFGPIPDPRVDTITQALTALTSALEKISAVMLSAMSRMQADLDEIPKSWPPPDPRMDAVLNLLVNIQDSADILIMRATTADTSLAVLNGAFSTLFTEDHIQFDAITAQLRQVIAMIGTTQPPPPPKRSIGAGTVYFTSQSAPTLPGP